MSQENIEIIRGAFEAFQGRGAEPVFAFLARDVEWEVRPDLPDAGIYEGHAGVRKLFSRFADVMDDMWFRPEEFIQVNDEVFVVPVRWGGRGKGAPLPVLDAGAGPI